MWYLGLCVPAPSIRRDSNEIPRSVTQKCKDRGCLERGNIVVCESVDYRIGVRATHMVEPMDHRGWNADCLGILTGRCFTQLEGRPCMQVDESNRDSLDEG